MKFYHFGDFTDPVIMLLPRTCCHWKLNFGGRIYTAYGCSLGGSSTHLIWSTKNCWYCIRSSGQRR